MMLWTILERLSPQARGIFDRERAAALEGSEDEAGANAAALFAALHFATDAGELAEDLAAAWLRELAQGGPAALGLLEPKTPEPMKAADALRHFLARLPVVFSIDGKARWGGKDGKGGEWTQDLEAVTAWIAADPEAFTAGRRQLRTLPSLGGFLVLDLDRGHADAEDGIETFRGLFDGEGMLRSELFRDLDRFPAFTRSPSGGLHLYFKARDLAGFPSGAIAPGVEIHSDRALITIPPSTKAGKPYQFFGSLDAAPELEALGGLRRLLKYAKAKEPRPEEAKRNAPRAWERAPLGRIFAWAKKQEDPAARAASWAYDEGYQPDAIRAAAREAGFALADIDAALYAKAEAKEKENQRPELSFIFEWTFNGRTGANEALFSASGWAYRVGYSRSEVEAEARARGYDPSNQAIRHAIREGR